MGLLDRYGDELDVVKKYFKIGIILFIIAILFGGVVKKVPAGHVGVLFDNTRGGIQLEEFNHGKEGWGLKLPFFQSVEYVDVRTQTLEHKGEGAIIPKDKNGVNFRWDVIVRYRLDKSQVSELIKTKGSGYTEGIISSGLRAKSREVLGKYEQEKLPEVRLEISNQIREALQNRIDGEAIGIDILFPGYIVIEAIDLRNLEYNSEIEQRIIEKQQRQQEAEKQVYELQIAEKLKERTIIEAEAQKAKTELEAEAQANAKKLIADAEAYAITQEAAAKAAGIDKINKAYQGMPLSFVMTKAYEAIRPTDKIIFGLDSLGTQNLGIMNYNQLMGALTAEGTT